MLNIYMQQALLEAQKAFDLDEVPVGAVVVKDNEIIGRGHNSRETMNDPTLHAEIVALRQAAQRMNSWRLTGCEIYVTIEPCPMCAGALIQSRIDRLVYGAADPKAGCAGTLYNLLQDARFNHRVEIVPNVMEQECAGLMRDFFKQKRGKKF